MCINLKWWIIPLKVNLLLMDTNAPSDPLYLSAPIVKGNKIYCSKKDTREILPINRIVKKIEIIAMDPNNPQTILLILKLKTKYIKDKKIIIKAMYPVGVCFVKKDSSKIIGRINQ